MSLTQYHKKRVFDKTPEPKGKEKTTTGPLTFVIQRHEASRLHYDFRLEMEGVLKSWAVPKGPSLNPDDKRLAMMVEDHPLDYASFEGIIPKGQYGGGTVMVWDQGVYMPYGAKTRKESEKILLEQLKKGHLTFVLLGKKLQGEFALVKTHGMDEENAWLLIKAGDQYVSQNDILKQDKSVLTDRSMAEIASQAEAKKQVWVSVPKDLDIKNQPQTPFPHQVKPMLATSVNEAFDREGWIFEMKWDGYRAIAEVENSQVKLYSRNQQPFEEKFAPIVENLKQFPSAVLDGEVVCLDKDGKPVFQWLQDYPKTRKGELVYYVFDILYLNGRDLTSLSLLARKEILQKVLPTLPNIRFSDHIETQGKEFFKQAQKMELEGIIGKKTRSTYQFGQRSDDWVKIKTNLRQEAIICGFTEGKGGRKHFGALILGVYKAGKLTYIGHTGGGFDEELLESIQKKLQPLRQDKCPFETKPDTNAAVTWVKPQLICEVEFRQWTEDGQMRQPIFIGLREDKSATEVEAEGQTINSDEVVTIDKRQLKLTNIDKVFWSDEGYTKGQLIAYYHEVAEVLLPHLKNRPQSLLRYPNGITGEAFFQKDVSNLKLDWMMRARITHDKNTVEYMLIQDLASLLYVINLGCIDLNPWNSRAGHLNKPDYLIIDLDPEDISFEKVVEVAKVCHQVLEGLNIPSYPKTSGASGMHIYIPMGAKYTYEQVRNLAHLLCIQIHEKIPEITSLERSPKNRQKKVYLDYMQNNRGQTVASVYSVRPKPEAPVSTPLKWSEVSSKLHPTQFTIKNIPARIQKQGDLFKEVLGKGVDFKKILKKIDQN